MFFSLAAVEVGTHLYWTFAGFTVHGQVLLVTWLVIATILAIAIAGTLKLEQIPKGLQNFVESVFEYVAGIAKDQIGEYECSLVAFLNSPRRTRRFESIFKPLSYPERPRRAGICRESNTRRS